MSGAENGRVEIWHAGTAARCTGTYIHQSADTEVEQRVCNFGRTKKPERARAPEIKKQFHRLGLHEQVAELNAL